MRAARFPLHLRVRYRRADDGVWLAGVTENISHSGALIHGEDLLQVDTAVEVRVALPLAPTNQKPAVVACRGRVVRTVAPDNADTRPGLAVSIDAYDFLPPAVDSSPFVTV
jgi:PilZ domain-containing protein